MRQIGVRLRESGRQFRRTGSTSPNRMLASASAPRMPGYQISMAAPPCRSTASPPGRRSPAPRWCADWRRRPRSPDRPACPTGVRCGISRPSLVGSLTNTMAISDAFASAAAAAASAPSLYSHLGLRRLRADGLERRRREPDRRTAEPAGASSGRIDLRGATAREHARIGVRPDDRDRRDARRARAAAGCPRSSAAPTPAPRSSARCPRPWNGSTTRPSGGSSTIPTANSVRTIRCTMSSSRDIGTSPLSTAFFSASPKRARRDVAAGLLVVHPAMAALAVLCVAPQSETTNALEAPGLLQQLVQEIVVLARLVAVDLVVGAHHHAGLAFE